VTGAPYSEPTLSLATRARRARRIGGTVGRAWLGLRTQRWIERTLAPRDMEERWREQHRRNAEDLYDAAVELQGLILKGAQLLGSRPDVLPPDTVSVLSRLQDRVPARPYAVVRRAVERELRRPLTAVFRRFSKAPVASASLAQVHEAELLDGRRVAVKVQYPGIGALVQSDLGSLRFMLGALARVERDFDWQPLLDELGDAVPRELDFVREARSAERVARDLAERPDLRIPRVIWELTTRRVLVMEFMEGIRIGDQPALRAAGVDVGRLARSLLEIFCEQILEHGFFHADPHPGNLLVQPDGPRLVLLDFGLSKELPREFRRGVVDFAAALLSGRTEGLGEALVRLGFETRHGRGDSLQAIVDLLRWAGEEIRSRGQLDPETIERLRLEIPERIRRDPIIRIPHHLVLIGRALGLLSGQVTALGARVDLLQVIAPHLARAAQQPR
jgi:predicted unusual protein kinase regulating ubiquinone biosynthesis (AarF/ABC1/UbiB family)